MSIQQAEGWHLWERLAVVCRQALRRTVASVPRRDHLVITVLAILLTGTGLMSTLAAGYSAKRQAQEGIRRMFSPRCAKDPGCYADAERMYREAMMCMQGKKQYCQDGKKLPASCSKGAMALQSTIPSLLYYMKHNQIAPPIGIEWVGLPEALNVIDKTSSIAEVYVFGSDSLRQRQWRKIWQPYIIDYLQTVYGLSDMSAPEWDKWTEWWAKTAGVKTGLSRPGGIAGKIIWGLDKATGTVDVIGFLFDGYNLVKDPNWGNAWDVVPSAMGVLALLGESPLAVLAGAFEVGYGAGQAVEWGTEQLFGWAPSDIGYALSDLRHPESPPYKDPD